MTKTNGNGSGATSIHISLQGKGGVGKSLISVDNAHRPLVLVQRNHRQLKRFSQRCRAPTAGTRPARSQAPPSKCMQPACMQGSAMRNTSGAGVGGPATFRVDRSIRLCRGIGAVSHPDQASSGTR